MMPLKMFRQRYVLIDQVFSLSSIEVESPQRLTRRTPPGPSPLSLHTSSQNASDRILWKQKAEDVLWLASAFFILYYGDFRSNFFSLLANDPRIWRPPLHIAFGCLVLDFLMLLYLLAIWLRITQDNKLGDLITASAIQAPTIVAFAAFILLSIALWPVWNILTVPMLFTLFMALVVVVLNVLPYIHVKMDPESMLPLH